MSLIRHFYDYELLMRQSETDELPFMYANKRVRYEIRLRADGSFRDLRLLSDGRGKKKDLGMELAVPHLVRSSGVRACLCVDNGEYVLGIPKKEGDPKATERFQAFRNLLQETHTATAEPSLGAILKFLESHDPAAFAAEHPSFEPDLNVGFVVDGVRPQDLAAVRAYWASTFTGDESTQKAITADPETLLLGEDGPVMEREPVKIKGILGGQTSGMTLMSANVPAFESYGLSASQNARVTVAAAETYAKGLNRLLASPDTSFRIAGVTYAFWSSEGAVPLIGTWLIDPPKPKFTKLGAGTGVESKRTGVSSSVARQIIQSAFKGQELTVRRGAAFYMVAMTPSGSRIAVRSHLISTVQETLDRLTDFFAAQMLVIVNDEHAKYPDPTTYSVYALVGCLHRDLSKASAQADLSALVDHALSGKPLPLSFLPRLAARNRAEQTINRSRAVLIKMVLLSRSFKETPMNKDTLDALDVTQPDPAYHLGRLLAVLDNIQSSVMKANTTLVDRFYGSMSTTPYAVMGRLIHGSQAHLQKLRKEKESAYYHKQALLEEVLSRIPNLSRKPLNTAQQALFALGYYHQRAEMNAEIRRASEAKKQRLAEQTATQSAPQTIE